MVEYHDLEEIPANIHVIASGPSPRAAVDHAVIWLNGQVVHDPHPDKTGLAGPPDRFWQLVPIPETFAR